MAIGHLHRQPVSRKSGQSIVAKAAYNACSILGAVDGPKDYTKKGGLMYQTIITADGQPTRRGQFWRNVEAQEKRKDSQLGYSYDAALPIELTLEQQREIADTYAQALLTRYNLAAVDICIHHPKKRRQNATSPENPHVHILHPTRNKDGQKLNLYGNTEDLLEIRKLWEDTCNKALANAGIAVRIDMRSYADQYAELETQIADMEAQEIILTKQLESLQNDIAAERERTKPKPRTASQDTFWQYRSFKNHTQHTRQNDQEAANGDRRPETKDVTSPGDQDFTEVGGRTNQNRPGTGSTGGPAEQRGKPGFEGATGQDGQRGEHDPNNRQRLNDSLEQIVSQVTSKITDRITALRFERQAKRYMEDKATQATLNEHYKAISTFTDIITDRIDAARLERTAAAYLHEQEAQNDTDDNQHYYPGPRP